MAACWTGWIPPWRPRLVMALLVFVAHFNPLFGVHA